LLLLLLVFLLLLLLLLLPFLLLQLLHFARRDREAVVLLAVLRELCFGNGGVVGVLQSLLVVRDIHHVEIVVAREQDGFAVRREGRPARPTWFFFIVLDQRHLRRCHVVFEVERFGAGIRWRASAGPAAALPLLGTDLRASSFQLRASSFRCDRLWLGRLNARVARHLDFELERGVPFDESNLRERQVLCVVGDSRDRRERRRHLRVIEERPLRSLYGIHQVEAPPLAGLIRVPESIARFEPSGSD
jgi:hypothetical protein